MRSRAGIVVSIVASLLFLAVLLWPFLVKSPSAITTYYKWGDLNPLYAGVLVVIMLVVFAAARYDSLSLELGTGIGLCLGLGLVSFLITAVWAATARLDVFRAPGWALPAQRFVLVGFSFLIVLGFTWHSWANGLLSLRR